MAKQLSASASSSGLTVKAYAGDSCAMLAFNLDDHMTDHLAGFAVARRKVGEMQWTYLGNRLSFKDAPHDPVKTETNKFFSSDDEPFQKFWWLDFPAPENVGPTEYLVTVKRFKAPDGSELSSDQQVQLTLDVGPFKGGAIEVAFTRGYLSSQAYADEFKNAPYTSHPKTGWKFDTAPFQTQWAWLGAHARQAIIDFFEDCKNTEGATVDACVYDLNEPDIIQAFIAMGDRLRILSDNSTTHTDKTAAGMAYAAITKAGAQGIRGKYGRFQHDKILIKKVDGKPVRVLTGSTNFSVTGVYVNANHVLIFDDPVVAQKYSDMFNAALDAKLSKGTFIKNPISKSEFTFTEPAMPKVVASFAPHAHPTFSLQALLTAIKAAKSSVVFAVMDLDGQGEVLAALKAIHANRDVFSYGISDSPDPDFVTIDGTTVYTPTSKAGELVFSKANPEEFPPPFSKELEVTGGAAHIVHHKFVVIDFNGADPTVFCGSSNMADGGEENNGDNLLAVFDRSIATAFAIEGIRLVDHYAFAAALKARESAGKPLEPLVLKSDADQWWETYYTPGSIKETERQLFSR